jgi:hypothetical protein
MVRSVLAPGLAPTYRHDHITHGEVALSRDARAAAS